MILNNLEIFVMKEFYAILRNKNTYIPGKIYRKVLSCSNIVVNSALLAA